MPIRAKRVCRASNCHQTTDRQDGYCNGCCDAGKNTTANHRRNKQTDPFYLSPEWRRYRKWWLTLHPLCTFCNQPGQMVDHKKPIKEGGAKLDPTNTQTTCFRCHARKTGAERSTKRHHPGAPQISTPLPTITAGQ